MNPRPYQLAALDAVWHGLNMSPNVLLVAACSAGKTLIFSKIIKRMLEEKPDRRALILMDREILVRQTLEKLERVAPEFVRDIGIACASVSKDKDHSRRVTIASRQTLINMLNDFEPPDLIVVDEAHLLAMPKMGRESDQYGQIIDHVRQHKPHARLFGVTATPYRLNDGYIYGERNAPGCLPYFDSVAHEIKVDQLLSLGFLAPLTGYAATSDQTREALSQISLVGGEYNLGQISGLMGDSIHIQSAVEVWEKYAKDRKKTLAFCVTIDHAEKMAEAFNQAGIPATAIHSELTSFENYQRMEALKTGGYKVFCSVAKLTTGMDVVDIDCIIMARPIKSAALYKQILGRGQRLAPGKTDCIALDIVGNSEEFGTDLDNLKVDYKRKVDSDGQPVSKCCPQCFEDLHIAVRICPKCGYVYEREEVEADAPDMEAINFGKMPPEKWAINSIFASVHESKKSGKELLKVKLDGGRLRESGGIDYLSGKSLYLWLCFPEDGYSGFAVEKGASLWAELTGEKNIPLQDRYYPQSAQEAESASHRIMIPDYVIVDNNDEFPNVLNIGFNEVKLDDDVPF